MLVNYKTNDPVISTFIPNNHVAEMPSMPSLQCIFGRLENTPQSPILLDNSENLLRYYERVRTMINFALARYDTCVHPGTR